MPTAAQALKALYHLGEAYDHALLAHYMTPHGKGDHALNNLDNQFRKAAAELGYELRVPKSPAEEHAEALARRVAETRLTDRFDTVELGLR